MELNSFPRPIDDTGIGVQWSLGYPALIDTDRLTQRWIPLLRALGVKWVKYRHPGGAEFARLLIDNHIMPIVQIWQLRPNPGRLTAGQTKTLGEYIDAGARYFELGDTFDHPDAWQSGKMSDLGLANVVPHLIADIETVLQEGGQPGLPATTHLTPAWDVVEAICEAGREDLFEHGVWQAYQVAAGNLPLDFPNDVVNETGKQVTEEEYQRGFVETWASSTWGGRTRGQINADRLHRRNPETNIQETPAGWRRYEALDARIRTHLGRSIPILATSGGCIVGEATDPRYPTVSPEGHAARILEMARIMMGTSQRFTPAPGYLFCAAFSLLGNYALGHFQPQWEHWAWISPRWANGRLPIIDALAREPKRSRWGEESETLTETEPTPFVMPVSTEHLVEVEQLRSPDSTSESDSLEGEIDLVAPSVGRPLVELLRPPAWEAGGGEEVQEQVIPATFAEEPFELYPPASLAGRVAGGAGQSITLTRRKDETSITQKVTSGESFAFRELRPGEYSLSLEQTNLRIDQIQLTSGDEYQIDLNMPEWRWRVTRGEGGKGFSIVRCSVEGELDLPVRIWSSGWHGVERRTGSKPEYGSYFCELAPLGAGNYQLAAGDIEPFVELELDGDSIVCVEFVHTTLLAAEPETHTLPAGKGLHRYLLLARPFANKQDLLAVLGFIRIHRPACGFSIEEARWADEVLIVGAGSLRVTDNDQLLLEESGCHVLRIEESIAETMAQLADMGDPFVEQQSGN